MHKQSTERKEPARWRLYLVLVLCSVLPLLLFLYAADRLLKRNAIRTLFQLSEKAASDTGSLLEEKLGEAKLSLRIIAANPGGNARKSAGQMVVPAELEKAYRLERQSGYLAVYDAKGSLQVIYPTPTGGVQKRLASLPWIASATLPESGFISGAFPMQIESHHQAVAVVVPWHQPSGSLAGIYNLEIVRTWLRGVPESTTKWVTIVDQNGAQVFAPGLTDLGPLPNLSRQEEVKKVLAGQGGTELVWHDGRQFLITRHPLSSCGWGLLVEIPVSEINQALWRSERPVALLSLLFLALCAAIGTVIARLHRKLRESEQHVRQIVASTIDAFVAIDTNGNITDLNSQAETLFGWPKSEAVGQPLHLMMIPEHYRERHLQGMARFRATGEGQVFSKRLELSALGRRGQEFPVELSISHLRRGGKDFFSAFIRDISERKRAEKEVAALNAELRLQISQLEARNKELEAFSYSVSHDVRAPLRHIAGFSRILAQECGSQITPQGHSYLAQIQESAARMQRLVDDLLRFSKVGEQGLKWQMTPLGDIVAEVIAGLKLDLNGRDVTFAIGALPAVECDRGLMTQVFWNLLSNAMKFTAMRQHAVISVGESRQEGESVLFVQDNGIGFDMQHAENLFRAFQRLHGEQFEGSGVGLATVQRIILKHKGRIWAQSEPNSGASFLFTLGTREVERKGPHRVEEELRTAVSG